MMSLVRRLACLLEYSSFPFEATPLLAKLYAIIYELPKFKPIMNYPPNIFRPFKIA